MNETEIRLDELARLAGELAAQTVYNGRCAAALRGRRRLLCREQERIRSPYVTELSMLGHGWVNGKLADLKADNEAFREVQAALIGLAQKKQTLRGCEKRLKLRQKAVEELQEAYSRLAEEAHRAKKNAPERLEALKTEKAALLGRLTAQQNALEWEERTTQMARGALTEAERLTVTDLPAYEARVEELKQQQGRLRRMAGPAAGLDEYAELAQQLAALDREDAARCDAAAAERLLARIHARMNALRSGEAG